MDRYISANQQIHGALAKSGEYDLSPHMLEENKRSVFDRISTILPKLLNLKSHNPGAVVLDLGCGTGFMFDILTRLNYKNITGLDITSEMIEVARQKYPDMPIVTSIAESTPFDDCTFELVTSYSFLDHINDLEKLMIEVARILKPGGCFYSGLVPNQSYAANVSQAKQLNTMLFDDIPDYISSYIEKEKISLFSNGAYYAEKYGLDAETLDLCEPQKSKFLGVSCVELASLLRRVGFNQVYFVPNWFFGEYFIRDMPADHLQIKQYLDQLGPISLCMYKYFDLFAIKE